MKIIIVTTVLVLAALPALAQNQSTLRDSGGRTIGTATRDSQGTTTYRDAGGRTVGTGSRDSQGTTTYRDAGGRTTGTATGGIRR